MEVVLKRGTVRSVEGQHKATRVSKLASIQGKPPHLAATTKDGTYPVSSKRLDVRKLRTVLLNILASFFKRWASSMTKYFQVNF